MSGALSTNHGISFGLQNKLTGLDYADDICLPTHKFSQMQISLNNIAKRAVAAGLSININKTKSMRLNSNCSTKFQLDGSYIEDVQSFCYLGSYISNNGGSRQDIQHRLSKAKQAFGTLNKIWRSSNITQRTKVHNANVQLNLLYGGESWNLTARDAQQLQAFANRCLRRILHVFWPATITNNELGFRTNQPLITDEIMMRKYKWLGHMLRKPADDIARNVLDFNPQGSRRPGRPRNTWKRQTKAELRNAGKSCSETKRLALDRVSWIRKRDLHILTVGILTYTNDQRFQSLHTEGSDEWTLRISSPQPRDSGTYECQVSTEPKISQGFRLNVVVSRAKILGNAELFIKSGSDINLTCLAMQSPIPPSFIYWYKGKRVMNYSQRGGINVIMERSTRTSKLLIAKATPADSGNYTCSPSSSGL
ncbi:uncharacterized protein LOC119677222 [Teleopsis dalmanni]|uniref:uncharacterized protein LOC119677222 n=1 Tax=Teleopsis dalmanni TaxID=139649 RepID=UPI0018CE4856|nr:uncharacterized protein LOC119677222 [Teleopsis dalmanni]